MNNRMVVTTVFALAACAAGAARAQDPTPPTAALYRVLHDSATTAVEGLFRVDASLFGGASCDYTAEVEVKDSRGNSLQKNKWDGACPVIDGRPAPALEVFRFGMPEGETFTVDITVNPKDKPSQKHRRSLKVSAFGDEMPLMSDLIMGTQVGLIDSTNASQWTFRRGEVGVRAGSEVVVEPGAPNVAYYVELYPRANRPVSGTVYGVVRRTDGVELTRFVLQQLNNVATFYPVAGMAKLAGLGLTPGDYSFEVQLALGDTTVTASHPFVLLPEATLATGAASQGYFSTVSDEDIEKKFGGVVLWLTQKAEADLYRSLSPAGKREFLNRMFGSAQPTPDDNRETEGIDAFVTRSIAVDRRFSEKAGRGEQEGWKTERGKIYMLHGEPNSVISRPSPRSGAPYEIFFYQLGRGLAYLFADETRLGHYRLVWTNDPNEQGVVGGINRVGPEAQEDLQRLGVRVSDVINQ